MMVTSVSAPCNGPTRQHFHVARIPLRIVLSERLESLIVGTSVMRLRLTLVSRLPRLLRAPYAQYSPRQPQAVHKKLLPLSIAHTVGTGRDALLYVGTRRGGYYQLAPVPFEYGRRAASRRCTGTSGFISADLGRLVAILAHEAYGAQQYWH